MSKITPSKSLDDVPESKSKPSGSPVPIEQGEPAAEENYRYWYVDYGLLVRRNNHDFWGNWATTASEACNDKRVDSYISRHDMRDYDFVLKCDHHSDRDDRIWVFTIAVGG